MRRIRDCAVMALCLLSLGLLGLAEATADDKAPRGLPPPASCKDGDCGPTAVSLRLKMLASLRLHAEAEAGKSKAADKTDKGYATECLDDLEAAKRQAAKENLPLLVWVGGCDPAARKQLDASGLQAVHAHADAWFGDKTPRLVLPWSADSCSSLLRGQITPENVSETLRLRGRPAALTPAAVAPRSYLQAAPAGEVCRT